MPLPLAAGRSHPAWLLLVRTHLIQAFNLLKVEPSWTECVLVDRLISLKQKLAEDDAAAEAEVRFA